MGFLKGGVEDQRSPLAGLPARLFAGYFFLHFGLEKAAGDLTGPALHKILTGWTDAPRYVFYQPFLLKVVIPHPDLFAFLATWGEIAIGAGLLAGCATRLASLAGIVLCLNIVFAGGKPLLSTETPVLFILLLLTVYLTAAGRALGLDALLKKRLPRFFA